MNRITYMFCLLSAALLFVACGSSRRASENVSVDSASVSSQATIDAVSSELSRTEEHDSSDVYVWTITTEYDTSKADSTGKSPILRQTESLTVKHSGKKKENDTKRNENISATKEESAKEFHGNTNKRENTRAESKKPLYYSYIIYGVALVILMAVLAYWVFTKYRAARPQHNNKA